MPLLFDLPPVPTLALGGDAYPIARIFCVGRNYAAHAAEMGNEVDREAPFYFTKNPRHVALSGATLPYPPGTEDYHHEMELVVAIGAPLFRATREEAAAAVLAHGCGLDMTRRDLQAASKDKRRPWDTGKDVEASAILGPLAPAGDLTGRAIRLTVNGETRQDASLDEMIHDVPAILSDLSRLYHLTPGDLILTGTPAGVGPVRPGDRLVGSIDGLEDVTVTYADPE
ncbi:fumarylacetoacetate hydrolase family protein [Jannaschia formosa]|uniref:fumarylacetoacetate hydrolase family protein n=1 Tax=Jannaschia formosa TaxID=2259592 RepID=UPI000E1BCFC5|nr:fumarylacetoacetate hydrolase family protein [Jannaschia formosa]TFL18415.1 FAA hydrolase family protein [Jannaschia formosa]